MNERKQSLLERLDQDVVLVAEGYIFELERRGYIKAGPFVPEVVLEYPEAVGQLHEEFVRAGSDVVVACTYYGHRSKLKAVGRQDQLEALNRNSIEMAKQAAEITGAPPHCASTTVRSSEPRNLKHSSAGRDAASTSNPFVSGCSAVTFSSPAGRAR